MDKRSIGNNLNSKYQRKRIQKIISIKILKFCDKKKTVLPAIQTPKQRAYNKKNQQKRNFKFFELKKHLLAQISTFFKAHTITFMFV